jgi:adenine-specific DNA methylase
VSNCPRLIEVALPIREISAESVRDKSLRHGHISTLHLWWARRPLAASRAVVFATLVPDPDDARCLAEFRALIERHLKTNVPGELQHYTRGRELHRDPDPYRPYDGVPDTLRNRLLMFIAKWSPEALAFEAGKASKAPKPVELLDDRSLVKWEISDPQNAQGREVLRIAREFIGAAYGGSFPRVLDPFSGGGAIPLEAGRLGCQAIAGEYNPVAAQVLRATCEFPQKFGRPGKRRVVTEEFGKRVERETDVPNVLAYDVEWWCKWVLSRAREKIGHLYPPGTDGRPVVGYLWARTSPCANPSCRGEMPLLRSLLICNKPDKKVSLRMEVDKTSRSATFSIAKTVPRDTAGTMLSRGNVKCPYCEQVTPVAAMRAAGLAGQLGERMIAVILEGEDGKGYREVEEADLAAFGAAAGIEVERPAESIIGDNRYMSTPLYGMKTWGSLFNSRQLVAMQTFVGCVREALDEIAGQISDDEYRKALEIYLGLWLSRNSMRMCSVGRWNDGGENFETPFDGARLPMKWDYPEANPFAGVTGGFENQMDWMIHFLNRESSPTLGAQVVCGDSADLRRDDASGDAVVTDPPYFDEAAYADLSDFFYVWLKRTIGDRFPEILATPQAPKTEEATALKHRHGGDGEAADRHFTDKLAAIFREAKRVCVPDGLFTVVFAHQETQAWTALIHSLFGADMTIDATWPIDMERKVRPRGINSAALETSIAVVCRPRVVGSAASFRDVRREVEAVVRDSVQRFWSYGFRGADLIVACYGPAVGVFGKYERVEKADGTPVEVPELLDLARRAARDAIAGEFRGDNLSTLYYVWANLYGAAEQAWDDARLVVQIGGDAEDAMEVARNQGIFVLNGSSCRLALFGDRSARRGLGVDPNPPLIDALHRCMLLWKEEKRPQLVAYLAERDLMEDGPFWKLAQSLFEVLPRDSEDWKLVSALLSERHTLRTEARRTATPRAQGELDLR